MKTTDKAELFETSPIPVAVTKLCIPTVLDFFSLDRDLPVRELRDLRCRRYAALPR